MCVITCLNNFNCTLQVTLKLLMSSSDRGLAAHCLFDFKNSPNALPLIDADSKTALYSPPVEKRS